VQHVTVSTKLSRFPDTGNVACGAFMHQMPRELGIILLASARPRVFSDSIEFVVPTDTDKIFSSSQWAVIKPVIMSHGRVYLCKVRALPRVGHIF
jgi:hypothetical protein